MRGEVLKSVGEAHALRRFFWIFVAIYAAGTWLPQFCHTKFKSSEFTMALAKQGMDLYAVQYSAQRFAAGLSPHFIDLDKDAATYPFSMKGVTQAYGNLATLVMLPVRNLDFSILKSIWLFASIAMLLFVFAKLLAAAAPSLPKSLTWLGALGLLVLSGPVTLLLERGQLEVLVPFLLFFFWREYVVDRLTWRGASAVGLVIHLKIWPVMLVLLLLHRKYLVPLLIVVGIPVLITLGTAPWFPLDEYIRAVRGIGDATAEMHGWLGVSLFSLVSALTGAVKWRTLSFIWLGLTSLVVFAIDQRLARSNSLKFRRLLFVLTLICSGLTPGYLCDYCLISAVFLLPAADEVPWAIELTAAVALSSLLFLNYYAGLVKVVVLLTFVAVAGIKLALASARLRSRPANL